MAEETQALVLEILRRMQSDLRQERTAAALQVKVDRIETRLEFTDH